MPNIADYMACHKLVLLGFCMMMIFAIRFALLPVLLDISFHSKYHNERNEGSEKHKYVEDMASVMDLMLQTIQMYQLQLEATIQL